MKSSRYQRERNYSNISATVVSFLFISSTDLYKDLVASEKLEELGPQFTTNSE